MDYIKETEKILKNHGKLNIALGNLNKRQENLIRSGVPTEIGAIDYSKPAIQHTNYSKDTLNQMCELAVISEEIKETKNEIKLVDKILQQIKKQDEISYNFLYIKYVKNNKISMREVADKLGYSPDSSDTVYRIKEKALIEFSILYFGVRAVKRI